MKKKSIAIATAVLALLSVGGVSVMSALAQDQEGEAPASKVQKAPRAKIGPVEAIRLATSKVPGRPLSATFEFDEGNWVYGVMIAHNHQLSEVEIDPMTGKIGDVESATPDGEAKETLEELTAAIK